MTTIREGRLEIVFDETWRCVKWDEHASYRRGVGVIQGSCAVDIVGIREGALHLIELKDFRDHRIENKERQPLDLPLEIASKVRDTVAGLVGASITRDDPLARECALIFGCCEAAKVRVCAWIAEDHRLPRKDRIHAAVRGKQLATRLRWLTTKVRDANPLVDPELPGVTVRVVAADSSPH